MIDEHYEDANADDNVSEHERRDLCLKQAERIVGLDRQIALEILLRLDRQIAQAILLREVATGENEQLRRRIAELEAALADLWNGGRSGSVVARVRRLVGDRIR